MELFSTAMIIYIEINRCHTAWMGIWPAKTINGKVTVEIHSNHPKACSSTWPYQLQWNSNHQPGMAGFRRFAQPGNPLSRLYGTNAQVWQVEILLWDTMYTPTGRLSKVFEFCQWLENDNVSVSTNSTSKTKKALYMVVRATEVRWAQIRSHRHYPAHKRKSRPPASQPSCHHHGWRREWIDGAPLFQPSTSLVTKTGGVQTFVFYVWDQKLTQSGNSGYGLGGTQTFTWNGSSYDVTPGGGSCHGSNQAL